MKAIPLILSTADVKAIIAGNKTRHTVPVKPKYTPVRDETINGKRMLKPSGWPLLSEEEFISRFSPFGSPGDSEWQTGMPPEEGMYWVNGIGTPMKYVDRRCPLPYQARWKRMGSIMYCRETWLYRHKHDRYYYKADWPDHEPYAHDGWKSPVTMPREASRIWLEVTDVVCKRVQDITEEEAKEHGCILYNGSTQIQSFSVDYGKRHGPDSWNNNDFVFSASFKVLSTTGKPSYL